jgi:hypothetical protein
MIGTVIRRNKPTLIRIVLGVLGAAVIGYAFSQLIIWFMR